MKPKQPNKQRCSPKFEVTFGQWWQLSIPGYFQVFPEKWSSWLIASKLHGHTGRHCPWDRNLWSLCPHRECRGKIHRWVAAWWQGVTCWHGRLDVPSQTCILRRPLDCCRQSAVGEPTLARTSEPVQHIQTTTSIIQRPLYCVSTVSWLAFNGAFNAN